MSRIDWARYPDDVEPVVAICLARRFQRANHIRPSQGDGGIDIQVANDDETTIDVYQVKRFATNLTGNQKKQVEGSYNRLLDTIQKRGLLIRQWHLTMPLDPTPENLEWLAGLTTDAPFVADWKGLDFVDGLASEYPSVIDYYLRDGAERLATATQTLAAIIHRRTSTDLEGAALQPVDVASDLRSIYLALNEYDPHYRYSSRVDEVRPDIHQEEDLVAAQQSGADGVCITHYIYARYPDAVLDRPIRIGIELLVEPEGPDADALVSFNKFGTPLSAPAAIDIQMPAGLGREVRQRASIHGGPAGG